MTRTMDIAILLDCSSSMASYTPQVRISIQNVARTIPPGGIRMALITFRSHSDNWVTRIHPFTSSIETFLQYLNMAQYEGGGLDGSEAIADALSAAHCRDWRSKDNNPFHENVIFLITDGPPCGLGPDAPMTQNGNCACGKDLWQVADEIKKKDITLFVVGVEPSVVAYDYFYCALAKKTGGEYLPLVNGARILSSLIRLVICEENTLRHALLHIKMVDIEQNSLYRYSDMQNCVDYMLKHCQTMSDIKNEIFKRS